MLISLLLFRRLKHSFSYRIIHRKIVDEMRKTFISMKKEKKIVGENRQHNLVEGTRKLIN